ncbi:hypothetical protein ACIQ7D_24230 [Streptomyces sp. NPDC096310]|uniref:hypothetical protein n=1 Tax=Streptomyces sp. NPDC096310 TaxID=3366082 RepID=UPI0037F3EDB8
MVGADERNPDVRRSIQVGEVVMPELAPDEVLMAVMASAVNFDIVWSATFEPVPAFAFLERFGSCQRGTATPLKVVSGVCGVVKRALTR